jgi:hypothetical protein
MNQTVNPATLRAGTASPLTAVILSHKQALEIGIAALKQRGGEANYCPVYDVEGMTKWAFNAADVRGTGIEVVVNALRSHGADVPMTLGGAMSAMYPDLTPEQQQKKAHDLVCFCHERSATMSGQTLINRLQGDLNNAN